jgi:hypothetical protein
MVRRKDLLGVAQNRRAVRLFKKPLLEQMAVDAKGYVSD